MGFPGSSAGKRICLECRRPGFNPWVGKIPWRRAWKPTPVVFPGESPGQMSLASSRRWWRTGKPGMLQSMEMQRVRHDGATKHTTAIRAQKLYPLTTRTFPESEGLWLNSGQSAVRGVPCELLGKYFSPCRAFSHFPRTPIPHINTRMKHTHTLTHTHTLPPFGHSSIKACLALQQFLWGLEGSYCLNTKMVKIERVLRFLMTSPSYRTNHKPPSSTNNKHPLDLRFG